MEPKLLRLHLFQGSCALCHPQKGLNACPLCRWPEAPSLRASGCHMAQSLQTHQLMVTPGHMCDLGSGEERCDQDRGRVPERGAGLGEGRRCGQTRVRSQPLLAVEAAASTPLKPLPAPPALGR